MKPHRLGPSDYILAIRFLVQFNLGCDTNNVPEEAEMWQLQPFMHKTASAIQNSRVNTDWTDKKYSQYAGDKTKYFTLFA